MTEFETEIQRRMISEHRCAICAMLQDREFDILSHLQYAVTHDESLRKAIAGEGGFCDFHFRQFRKLANAETNAHLLVTMIDEYCRRAMPVPLRCRLCADLASSENAWLDATCRVIVKESIVAWYSESSGMCLDHMHGVQKRIDNAEIRTRLSELQVLQMQRDLPALAEMSKRSYFDATQSQRSSIARVAEKFAGRKVVGL